MAGSEDMILWLKNRFWNHVFSGKPPNASTYYVDDTTDQKPSRIGYLVRAAFLGGSR